MPIQEVRETPFKPLEGQAHQSATLAATVLTLNTPTAAQEIVVQAVTENIRFTMDGTAPSATFGFQLVAGNVPVQITITQFTTLRFFREAAGAILEYQYGD